MRYWGKIMENDNDFIGPEGQENNGGGTRPPDEGIFREILSGDEPQREFRQEVLSPPAAGNDAPVSMDNPEIEPSAADETVEEKAREEKDADEEFGKELELIGFRLNNEEYAIPIEQVKEIIRPIGLTGIPRSPSILLGIISLRGVIVPVFDLKKKLTGVQEKPEISAAGAGEEVSAETLRRNIILQSGGGLLGLEVDSVTDVIRIREKEIEPAPPLLDREGQDLIKGVFRFKNRMVILLNNHNMIGMIEREIHADMAA